MSMNTLSILIADDHDIVRKGLKNLLEEAHGAIDLGEARDSDQLLRLLEQRRWNLILLDILMPGLGVMETLAEIRRQDTDVPVLILTAVPENEYAVQTMKAGANGFITKQHAAEELKEAVRKVLAGETYLSSGAIAALTADLRGNGSKAPHTALSRRELEVFCLIAKGKAVKEIAYELTVSAKTVGTYVARIKEKTGLDSYVDIARYALQNKLVD